jgi:hypothetical protein
LLDVVGVGGDCWWVNENKSLTSLPHGVSTNESSSDGFAAGKDDDGVATEQVESKSWWSSF